MFTQACLWVGISNQLLYCESVSNLVSCDSLNAVIKQTRDFFFFFKYLLKWMQKAFWMRWSILDWKSEHRNAAHLWINIISSLLVTITACFTDTHRHPLQVLGDSKREKGGKRSSRYWSYHSHRLIKTLVKSTTTNHWIAMQFHLSWYPWCIVYKSFLLTYYVTWATQKCKQTKLNYLESHSSI